MSKFKVTLNKDGVVKENEYDKDEIFQYVSQQIADEVEEGDYRHIIMKAGTGVGKSTEFMYELRKRLRNHTIICTEPTVFNALSLASFLGRKPDLKLGVDLGIETGPEKIDLTSKGGIIYATIGSILNKYLIPCMSNLSRSMGDLIIVVDEAHGNSADEEIALSVAKYLIDNMAQPPVFVIESASIDIDEFSSYFGSEIIYEIAGQRQPIVEFYIDHFFEQASIPKLTFPIFVKEIVNLIIQSKHEKLKDAIRTTGCNPTGDILIFVTGKKMVTDLEKILTDLPNNVKLHTLSRDSLAARPEIRDEINYPGEKVIISTNIAETGITFEHISYAIDCIKFKSIFYDPVRKTDVMRDLPICKNMMEQRRGRVGRITGGIYFGAITSDLVPKLMPFREKEIEIEDLKPIIFEMGLNTFSKLKFMFKVPDELFLDALEGSMLLGFRDNIEENSIYKIFVVDLPKLEPFYKMLLYSAFVSGLNLAQTIALVALLREEKPPRKRKVVLKCNDFARVLKKLDTVPISTFDFGVMEDFTEITQYFSEAGISIFQGEDLKKSIHKLGKILSRAFEQYLLRKHEVKKGKAFYFTDFGLRIELDCDKEEEAPNLLITNGFMDSNGKVEPLLLMDCESFCRRYKQGCVNGVYEEK